MTCSVGWTKWSLLLYVKEVRAYTKRRPGLIYYIDDSQIKPTETSLLAGNRPEKLVDDNAIQCLCSLPALQIGCADALSSESLCHSLTMSRRKRRKETCSEAPAWVARAFRKFHRLHSFIVAGELGSRRWNAELRFKQGSCHFDLPAAFLQLACTRFI